MEYIVKSILKHCEVYKNSKYFLFEMRNYLGYLSFTDEYLDLYEKNLKKLKISLEAVEKLIDFAIKYNQHQTYLILLKYKFETFKEKNSDLTL